MLYKMAKADDLKHQRFIHDSTWSHIGKYLLFLVKQHIQFDKNVGDLIIFSVDVSPWNQGPVQK